MRQRSPVPYSSIFKRVFDDLEHQIEERIDGMEPPLVADLTERFADDRGVGARDDVGVVEVALPHSQAECAFIVLAEPAPVGLVTHQLVALDLVAQVQRGRAGAELLEDDEVDAVGVHLERHGQVLPAEVPA